MKYFKNVELARIYHISEKSVRNWIEATEGGKLNLELFDKNGRRYIANNNKNHLLITELVQKGQKYKNSRSQKTIVPTPEFYELFNEKQVLDIISSIDIHREIPSQYGYFDGGATYWDKYSKKLVEEEAPNLLNSTLQLLKDNYASILRYSGNPQRVNVIDLGVGNCLPIRDFLATLHNQKLLGSYVGLDLSPNILEIAQQNLAEWFKGEVTMEAHVRDICYERFEDLFRRKPHDDEAEKSSANIAFLLGGTLTNVRRPDHALQVINDSLGRSDLFVYALKLDSEASRRYFDFDVEAKIQHLTKLDRLPLDLLGIEPSMYEVEQFFDPKKRSRLIQIRLKTDLSISFTPRYGSLHLTKGEQILLWRSYHQSGIEVINQLDRAGFDVLQVTKSLDKEYLLTISKIKTGINQ